MGGVFWSPQLQASRGTTLLQTFIQRKQKWCHVSSRHILRLKKRLKIKTELELSHTEVVEELSNSYKNTKYNAWYAHMHMQTSDKYGSDKYYLNSWEWWLGHSLPISHNKYNSHHNFYIALHFHLLYGTSIQWTHQLYQHGVNLQATRMHEAPA